MTEMDADERYPTEFVLADGKPATVFSAFNADRSTAFPMMQEYGVDGVFVQRFIADLADPRAFRHNNVVLDHCAKEPIFWADLCGHV